MDWTIETDVEAEARRRMGAIDGRFQVCHPVEGLVGVADALAEAFEIADHYATRTLPDGRPYCSTPFAVEVYDRMARRKKPRTWLRQSKEANTYGGSSDRLSDLAFWKCIEWKG